MNEAKTNDRRNPQQPIEDLGHRQVIHSRFVIVAEAELEGFDQLGEEVAQRCGQVWKR